MGDYASAADGAGTAAEGASTAGTAATATQGAAEGAQAAGLYGQMADVGANSGSAISTTGSAADFAGYSDTAATAGPTVDAAANLPEPSMLQQFSDMYGRFEQGGQNSLAKAYDKFGNNAETYGYLYNKLNSVKSMGGGAQSPAPIPINTTINQAPNSDYERYLAKYRGR